MKSWALPVGVFVFSSLFWPAGALAQDRCVQVTASSLNVRTGPGVTSPAFGLAHSGEVYPEMSRQGSWVLVPFGPRNGWVHSGYVRSVAVPDHEVTAGSLNVRTGPATRY